MITRRRFLSTSMATVGSALLPQVSFSMTKLDQSDPHFLLALNFYGGWDHSYLFDARPLDMTKKNLIQNYTGNAPEVCGQGDVYPWLMNPLAKPIQAYFDDFCIIKGVGMATSFDGHPQNESYIFTGSPFGGDSFIPVINQFGKNQHKKIPLDLVSLGRSSATITNGDRSVTLQPSSLKSLIEALRANPITESELGYEYLRSRYESLSSGKNGIAIGSKYLNSASAQSIALSQRLSQVEIDDRDSEDEIKSFLDMLRQFYKHQVGFSGQFATYTDLDTHSAPQAVNQPALYADVVKRIKTVMDFLKSTEFSQGKSLLDVTTVLMTSEFSRTMRINGFPIDNTGTNHNTFNNTVILAGKGIKGGQLIGDTDYQSAEEQLSKAHLQIDPIMDKTFGLPFDFKAQRAVADKPEEFKLENYLNFKHVVNTLYSLFEVPREHWWSLERNGPPTPLVSRILKS